MRTALEVESETAEMLRQLAKAQNISIDQLLSAYIPGLAPKEPHQNGAEVEDKVRAFEEWAASFPSNNPPLSDEAISRDSIYPDR